VPERVGDHFDRLARLWFEGRLDELARLHAFPCPYQIGGELVVMRNAPALEAWLDWHRMRLLDLGLSAIRARVSAVEMPQQERFRAWVRWTCLFGDGAPPKEFAGVYYLSRRAQAGTRIEMVDILDPVLLRRILAAV
jgi:hypothetical protein